MAFAFAAQEDKTADEDATSIDIVNTSAHSSKPGTPASLFPLCLTNTSAMLNGADGKRYTPHLHQGKSSPANVQHVAIKVGMQEKSAGPCASKLKPAGNRQSGNLAPFVRQAAPMVLCLDNLVESSEEVLDMELQNTLGALSLEELQRLNAML